MSWMVYLLMNPLDKKYKLRYKNCKLRQHFFCYIYSCLKLHNWISYLNSHSDMQKHNGVDGWILIKWSWCYFYRFFNSIICSARLCFLCFHPCNLFLVSWKMDCLYIYSCTFTLASCWTTHGNLSKEILKEYALCLKLNATVLLP